MIEKSKTIIKTFFEFISSNNSSYLCALFVFGVLFKVRAPGLSNVIQWLCFTVLKIVPISAIEGLYQFLYWIYKGVFLKFSVIWILVAISYIVVQKIKEKDDIYSEFRRSCCYNNIFTKTWFKFITNIWYLYKFLEIILFDDIRIELLSDYFCAFISFMFFIIYILSTFQTRN